jgi:hypothetical protein
MLMLQALLAMEDTIATRLIVCAVAVVVGIVLILIGINDVRTRTAVDSDKARIVNELLGQSNVYEGKKAVLLGIVRIVSGIFAIIFGIVFVFVGPFLASGR